MSDEYSVADERDTVVMDSWDDEDDELLPLRTVFIVDVSRLNEVMTRMRTLYALAS